LTVEVGSAFRCILQAIHAERCDEDQFDWNYAGCILPLFCY
jgi:hypothetical protein